jgi:hypothetical protein
MQLDIGIGHDSIVGGIGGDQASAILAGFEFSAPLKTSLALARGAGSPTFTRATTATIWDNENKLITVPSGAARFGGVRYVQNLLTSTENYSAAAWAKLNCTVANAAGPTGANDATLMTVTAAANNGVEQNIAITSVNGPTRTASVYIKAGNWSWFRVMQYDGGGANQARCWINAQTATIGTVEGIGTFTGVTASIEPYENGWFRLSITGTGVVGSNGYFRVIAQDANSSTSTSNVSGATILLWHPQMENVTGQVDKTASEYVSVGVLSAPYHGLNVDGVKAFSTNKNGTPIEDSSQLGYLSEPAATNNLLYSRDLTQATVWTATNITPTKTATGIDGTPNSATTLTAISDNATILQQRTLAAAARSSQAFVKRRAGSGSVYFTRGSSGDGVELISNGDFSSDTVWTKGTNCTISGGALNMAASATATTQPISFTAGVPYIITFTISAYTSGQIRLRPGGSSVGTFRAALGTYSEVVIPTANGAVITTDLGSFIGSIDNVSVQKVAWTDITASLSASAYYNAKIENTSVTNPSVGFKLAVSGDAIDVDYVQDEAGESCTSPIATTTATVTRNVDVLTYASSGNILGTAGSSYAKVNCLSNARTNNKGMEIIGTYSTVGKGIPLGLTSAGILAIYDGTSSRLSSITGLTAKYAGKLASCWDATSGKCAYAGTVSNTTSLDGDINIGSSIDIGVRSYTTSINFSGYISDVAIKQSAISGYQMKVITS